MARLKHWVDAGNRWFDNGDPFVMLNIQMLGHAEGPILELEANLKKPLVARMTDTHGLALMQCSALSLCWFLGFYEVLRTLRESAPVRFKPLASIFHEVEVARMPLAKHQVKSAPGYRGRFHYPTSVWEPTTGRLGWQVYDPSRGEMITVVRTELADRFLETP
jgi:hypothetical protein